MSLPTRVRSIIVAVAEETGVAAVLILSRDRRAYVHAARVEVARRLREGFLVNGLPPSYPLIGQWLNRTHAAVFYMVHGMRPSRVAEITARSSHLLSDINTSSTSLNPPNPAGVALVP